MDLLREKQRARGAHRALMGGDSPDTSGQNKAALMQAKLSQEQLDWAKEIYAEGAPDRTDAKNRANAVSDAQLEGMRQQTGIAAQANADYQSTYRPLEQSIVADASGYDSPQRRAAESAAAVSTVETNLAGQRDATMRAQERAGVNPASGKVADLQGSMDLNAAKLKAGAGNMASRGVETIGAAKRMDAANLGRNIASSQATSASLALNSGSSSVANSGAALAAQNNGVGAVNQGYSGAQSGLGGAANTYAGISSTQGAASAASSANTTAAVGAGATIAAMVII